MADTITTECRVMTPSEQVNKSVEELANLELKTERGMYWVRLGRVTEILIASQVALLESVVDGLKEEMSIYGDHPAPFVSGYELALKDQITFLTEQINKIKEL